MYPHDTTSIPIGLCHCGCGQPTKIARQTRTAIGHIKGQPTHFLSGHNSRIDHPRKPSSFQIRFWSKVNKDGPIPAHCPEIGHCWLWTGRPDTDGYGHLRLGGKGSNATTAHRVSWIIHFGLIPEGLYVCHHCDTPLCIRPEHLFLGSALDNNRDAIVKGRGSRLTRRQQGRFVRSDTIET